MVSLRELREAKGWSQADWGLLVGLSRPEVSLAETGKRGLSPDSRVRAMRALGLTADEVRQVPELTPFVEVNA